jgi:hypothetical protein
MLVSRVAWLLMAQDVTDGTAPTPLPHTHTRARTQDRGSRTHI